jgi:hypothetical protein
MKITRTQLRRLIKEELSRTNESFTGSFVGDPDLANAPSTAKVMADMDPDWADYDPDGVESQLAQELALEDNFENEEMFSRDSLVTKIVEAELSGQFKGIIDFILGQDV